VLCVDAARVVDGEDRRIGRLKWLEVCIEPNGIATKHQAIHGSCHQQGPLEDRKNVVAYHNSPHVIPVMFIR
jgi:hypothetical protein